MLNVEIITNGESHANNKLFEWFNEIPNNDPSTRLELIDPKCY